ncbi:MAG: hypothetical protein JNJ89_00435 [Rubrivivax sp.]|nr:hypothetical protein [Rubrivivax sp.]
MASLNFRRHRTPVSGLLALTLLVGAPAWAQAPYSEMGYPPTAGTAQAPMPASSSYDATPGRRPRGLFLATIYSLLAQGIGSSMAQGMGGSITRWFEARNAALPPNLPPGSNLAAPGATPPPLGTAEPTAQTAANWPSPQPAGVATGSDTAAPQLFTGVAYEVHLQGRDGMPIPVDPATHVFRTGERFVVHYRPNLPGRVEIHNVNPLGVETRIDALDVAGGELATLGPYEFADAKGDEMLRIVLSPCTTPPLMTATRNIVKPPEVRVATTAAPGLRRGAAHAPAEPAQASWALAACGSPAQKAAQRFSPRDIRKPVREGSTNFALDPIDRTELVNGALAPREITILLMHR